MLIIVNYFKLHLLPSFPKIMWGFPCQFSTVIHHWHHGVTVTPSSHFLQIILPWASYLSSFTLGMCVWLYSCVSVLAWPIHSCGLIMSARSSSGDTVQMKRRAWRWAGKTATETTYPRRSSAKRTHLSILAPPKPARDHISGWGPCRDPSSDTKPLAFNGLANQGASLQSDVSSPYPAVWLTH